MLAQQGFGRRHLRPHRRAGVLTTLPRPRARQPAGQAAEALVPAARSRQRISVADLTPEILREWVNGRPRRGPSAIAPPQYRLCGESL